jgi:hypothetical protein
MHMARLPTPGGDDGTWGQVLNDFLAQAHASDGTIKSGAVSATSIQDATISEAKLDAALQAKVNASDVLAEFTAGSYPLRNTVTTSLTRRVRWVGPSAPTIGSGYAADGDVWEKTP